MKECRVLWFDPRENGKGLSGQLQDTPYGSHRHHSVEDLINHYLNKGYELKQIVTNMPKMANCDMAWAPYLIYMEREIPDEDPKK